ncbi:hypothetical protein PHLCEN_2v3931 [Hermanssonia centrifuga]|uniref:Uncharacterized protein n=1 Tax=Hermanssonia centrifuga TaxID=98765 RepID=A0A2R6QB54_9APHY|nr:hypothetical protein PHLCEN_2v3931 [Hermanssonia centrifuga]
MADHIAVMLDLKHKITAAGEELPDSHVARALIISLPRTPSWDVIKIQCFALSKDKFTPENVGSTLQAEANRMARKKGSGETALFTQRPPKMRKRGKGKGPQPGDECRCGSVKKHSVGHRRRKRGDRSKERP